MLGCAPEVSFLAVLVDCDFDTSYSVLGVLFAIDLDSCKLMNFVRQQAAPYFETFYHGVGGVVGFLEILALDGSGLLEGEASLSHEALHTERIGGFDVEIGGIHVFVFTSTEEAKSTARRGKGLVGLYTEIVSTKGARTAA